jgi:hypothetical protein
VSEFLSPVHRQLAFANVHVCAAASIVSTAAYSTSPDGPVRRLSLGPYSEKSIGSYQWKTALELNRPHETGTETPTSVRRTSCILGTDCSRRQTPTTLFDQNNAGLNAIHEECWKEEQTAKDWQNVWLTPTSMSRTGHQSAVVGKSAAGEASEKDVAAVHENRE